MMIQFLKYTVLQSIFLFTVSFTRNLDHIFVWYFSKYLSQYGSFLEDNDDNTFLATVFPIWRNIPEEDI